MGLLWPTLGDYGWFHDKRISAISDCYGIYRDLAGFRYIDGNFVEYGSGAAGLHYRTTIGLYRFCEDAGVVAGTRRY